MQKQTERKRPAIQSLILKINDMSDSDRQNYAEKCGTSIGNLRQIAYGFGGVSPKLAKSIVKNCDCNVTFEQLIPELT
ncbi:helix-turn-helix domain-containing protein [Faucicola boevrei]|uniref:hypothetical protein n=1 Tax=Faucicola boevrei TaxID=346665 RepID=UPI000368E727|nr:hypothetical protein [Moraxella boevrei]